MLVTPVAAKRTEAEGPRGSSGPQGWLQKQNVCLHDTRSQMSRLLPVLRMEGKCLLPFCTRIPPPGLPPERVRGWGLHAAGPPTAPSSQTAGHSLSLQPPAVSSGAFCFSHCPSDHQLWSVFASHCVPLSICSPKLLAPL